MADSTSSRFLKVLSGTPSSPVPIWMMRQAGRHLPEYLELRSRAKDFLNFCYSPSMAAEATLQPIARYDMDAAILFADILLILDAMGLDVRFEKGVGPIVETVETAEEAWTKDEDTEEFENLFILIPADMKEHIIPIVRSLDKKAPDLDNKGEKIGKKKAVMAAKMILKNLENLKIGQRKMGGNDEAAQESEDKMEKFMDRMEKLFLAKEKELEFGGQTKII